VQGRVQREGEVVHLVANHLTGLSADLAGVGDRTPVFRCCRLLPFQGKRVPGVPIALQKSIGCIRA
jgi:hypothetical protein